MVLTFAQDVVLVESPGLLDTVIHQVTSIGGALLIIAAVAAALWRWVFKDRWEAAVFRAIRARETNVETEEQGAEKMVEALDQWSVGVREHVGEVLEELKAELASDVTELKGEVRENTDGVASLERTVCNGLTDRMERVEKHVEKLVAGQARMEGIMQMVVKQGERT